MYWRRLLNLKWRNTQVQYNVSVIANPADPETNTSSLAATTTVSTEADPNAGQVANTALFDFATMAASPEKPDSPDGVMTEDGCLMILTRGSCNRKVWEYSSALAKQ